MNTYFPDHKALWIAENVVSSMHNIYTLRGAPVRDALRWSRYMNEALYMFGQEAEVLVHFGPEKTQNVLLVRLDESERPESDASAQQ